MELIIKAEWTPSQRKENISNFIQIVGIDLFKRCQSCEYIHELTTEKITMNLCITYIESIIKRYFDKISFGSLKIELDDRFILGVAQLAEEMKVVDANALVGV